jgi:hypothetical protein
MPRVKFGSAEQQARNAEPIPSGTYTCQIAKVEEAQTRHGDPMWKLRLSVVEGSQKGRPVFDNLPFSSAATERVKLFCEALGLPTDEDFDLTPEQVDGRLLRVVVGVEAVKGNGGRSQQRNTVPFKGYLPVQTPDEAPTKPDLPF